MYPANRTFPLNVVSFPDRQGISARFTLPTIADLKAFPVDALRDGQACVVLGYSSAGDGGGGTFRFSATSTASSDGGTVFVPNAGNGRWLRVINGTANVKWFGAQGDGTTDDTTAFKNAIAAANGVVIAPWSQSGYKVTDALVWPSSQTQVYGLRGEGGIARITFSGVASTKDCMTLGGALSTQIVLENVVVDCGNGTTANGTCGRDGVVIVGSERPRLSNVDVYGAQRDGLVLSVGSASWIQKLRSDHVHIENSGRHALRLAIAADATGSFINESRFSSFEVHGLSLRYNGGEAIYADIKGTAAGSKISQTTFSDSSIDIQRALSVANGFDVGGNIVHCTYTAGAACNYEIWRFIGGGWETTSGAAIVGDMFHVESGATAQFWTIIGISASNIPVTITGLTSFFYHLPTASGNISADANATVKGHLTIGGGAQNPGSLGKSIAMNDAVSTGLTLQVAGASRAQLWADSTTFNIYSISGQAMRIETQGPQDMTFYAGGALAATLAASDKSLKVVGKIIGLNGAQSVTGSRGGNAALASLITNLAAIGLIVDNTTA